MGMLTKVGLCWLLKGILKDFIHLKAWWFKKKKVEEKEKVVKDLNREELVLSVLEKYIAVEMENFHV